MHKKVQWIVSLIVILTMSLCHAASLDTLNGYDKMIWGSAPNNSKLVLLGYDLDASFYEPTEKPQTVKIGAKNFKLRDIQYTFFDNQFSRIMITVDDISSQAVFLEIETYYGPPDKIQEYPNATTYSWVGTNTLIEMQGPHIVIESKRLVENHIVMEGSTVSQ